MLDKAAWEKADAVWRKGVEGIFNQLVQLLTTYHVTPFIPDGDEFDPSKHEALTNLPVSDKEQHNRILSTVQVGFTITTDQTERTIRPARVTVGEYTDSPVAHD
jgi:molecular chaperone GrpE